MGQKAKSPMTNHYVRLAPQQRVTAATAIGRSNNASSLILHGGTSTIFGTIWLLWLPWNIAIESS
jgi:hypothetical protein